MATLHIPVGIPGCGKSSFFKAFAHRDTVIVSTDAIREQMTGDENNQDRNGDVFKRFHGTINWNLGYNGYSVYADATNLTGRSDLRKIAARYDWVKTHLILFRNLEQAIARNMARERVVPADVMMHMIEKYERAVLDIAHEDYDYVTEVSATR